MTLTAVLLGLLFGSRTGLFGLLFGAMLVGGVSQGWLMQQESGWLAEAGLFALTLTLFECAACAAMLLRHADDRPMLRTGSAA